MPLVTRTTQNASLKVLALNVPVIWVVLGVPTMNASVEATPVGDWQWSDAVLPLVVLAVFPFVEWMIHVFILHWRPRRIAGVMIDPMLSRKHRAHHADPRIIKLIFIPLQSLYGALGSALVIAACQDCKIAAGSKLKDPSLMPETNARFISSFLSPTTTEEMKA